MEIYSPGIADQVSDFILTGTVPEPALGWVWLIPAIASTVSLINSAIQRRNDRRNQDRQNAANLALSDRQFEQNQQQIDELNKYNAPQAQMERFTAAGLNPDLIYGSGSGSAGNQTQVARAERPDFVSSARAVQLPEMLSQFQDFQMRQAQINNVKAQTDNIKEKTATESVTRFLRDVQGQRASFDLGQTEYLAPYQAAIVGNKARASEATLLQEWQKLQNLSADEQLKLLVARQKEKGLELMDIEEEQRKADLLFSNYRNEWMKVGITSSDSVFFRLLVRMFTEAGVDISTMNPFK